MPRCLGTWVLYSLIRHTIIYLRYAYDRLKKQKQKQIRLMALVIFRVRIKTFNILICQFIHIKLRIIILVQDILSFSIRYYNIVPTYTHA